MVFNLYTVLRPVITYYANGFSKVYECDRESDHVSLTYVAIFGFDDVFSDDHPNRCFQLAAIISGA